MPSPVKTAMTLGLSFTPMRSGFLQRKCACGGTPGPTGECEECRKNLETGMLQRKTAQHSTFDPVKGRGPNGALRPQPAEVPPIVHDVLRSPGQPLDAETSAFMESRFGHNSSQAQMHSNDEAAESARVVRAAAYTFSPSPSGSSSIAIQRMSATTAISVDGEELPQLSAPSGQGSSENVEDPDLALADIENGAPFKGTQADSGPRRGDRSRQPNDEDGAVQTAFDSNTMAVNSVLPSAVLAQFGSGQPLSRPLRKQMENGFGHDFSGVRVHTDAQADLLNRALGAHAFTVGEHIAFAAGRYHPGTSGTLRLAAHELTHVLQQRRGLSGSILCEGIGHPGDAYEREAEQMADRISAQPSATRDKKRVTPTSGPADTSALQLFSGSSAAAYAKKWATGTNPAYLRFGDDCTNFVSQAMEAGGWTQITGSNICDLRKTDSVWWFKRGACVNWKRAILYPFAGNPAVDASYTWGGAQNFFNFLKASGRGTPAKSVNELDIGDVVQRDHGDGQMHHSMVVTEKGPAFINGAPKTQIKLSYHTNDTLNRNFLGPGGIKNSTPRTWNYYPWKIK